MEQAIKLPYGGVTAKHGRSTQQTRSGANETLTYADVQIGLGAIWAAGRSVTTEALEIPQSPNSCSPLVSAPVVCAAIG